MGEQAVSDIGELLKALNEAISATKKVKEKIDANAKRSKKKKLLKACIKAIESGKNKDLVAVREHLYVRNWLK